MSNYSHELGVVGTHVEKSFSPPMQRAAYDLLGLNWDYRIFQLPKSDDKAERRRIFEAFLTEQAQNGTLGLSVTMPFKEDAVLSPQVTATDEAVQVIGAANTLSLTDKATWWADNTDWTGAVNAIEDTRASIPNKEALVIGAGGTARAVAYGLARKRAGRILIANRTPDRAVALANDMHVAFPDTVFQAADLADVNGRPKPYDVTGIDIVYNTTSVGQTGTDGEGKSPLHERVMNQLRPGAIVCDAVYMPLATPLLEMARERKSLEIVWGLKMLIHQAIEQVRIFSGREELPDTIYNTMAHAVGQSYSRRNPEAPLSLLDEIL